VQCTLLSRCLVYVFNPHLLASYIVHPPSEAIYIFKEKMSGSPMPPLREAHVAQAVNFLQDPRVRREPLVRAVHFLRAKNVTDVEVREAFSRLKLPYPENSDAAVPWGYPPPPPPQRGSAFMGTMVTLGLTAGALYAAREFLRVFVIPRYFPEFVPLMNGEGNEVVTQRNTDVNVHGTDGNNGVVSTRQHNALMKLQERQIETLKNTVEQLRAATCTTNERVERLSITLSTASQLAERRQQETAEIRDAIRQLSRTVSASNTPNNTDATYGRARSKDGSLAYNGGTNAITIDESQVLLTPDTEEKFKTPMMTAPNTQQKDKAAATERAFISVPSTNVVDIPQVEDAFLSVAPAEIETHWGMNILDSAIDTIDTNGTNSNKVSEKRLSTASDKVSSNTASMLSTAAAVVAVKGTMMESSTVTSATREDAKREEMLNTTRRLFQQSMKNAIDTNRNGTAGDININHNATSDGNENNENEDDNISRRSTKSAPDPELPITDDEESDVDVEDEY